MTGAHLMFKNKAEAGSLDGVLYIVEEASEKAAKNLVT